LHRSVYMINSHVHLIEEDTEEYLDTLVSRMDNYGMHGAVLFGAQVEQAVDDDQVQQAVLKYPDRFIPFLSKSVDITKKESLADCLKMLDSGFWKGVGEIFLDCSDDEYTRWQDRHGNPCIARKPVPEDKEDNYLYKALFNHCATKGLPVMVHCMDAEVMERTLAKYHGTRFIWAHVDHGFYRDIAISLMTKYSNLYCDFGVEFRYNDQQLLAGQAETWLLDHIERWRKTCRLFPSRVVWGTDLYSWEDLDEDNFKRGMGVWEEFSQSLEPDVKFKVSEGNILRLIGL